MVGIKLDHREVQYYPHRVYRLRKPTQHEYNINSGRQSNVHMR